MNFLLKPCWILYFYN